MTQYFSLAPSLFYECVEQKRRKELEIFLNRVAVHGELSSSQYLKTFLQVGRFAHYHRPPSLLPISLVEAVPSGGHAGRPPALRRA